MKEEKVKEIVVSFDKQLKVEPSKILDQLVTSAYEDFREWVSLRFDEYCEEKKIKLDEDDESYVYDLLEDEVIPERFSINIQ